MAPLTFALIGGAYLGLVVLSRWATRTGWLGPFMGWIARRSPAVQWLLAGGMFGAAFLPLFLAKGWPFVTGVLLACGTGLGFVVVGLVLKALGVGQGPPDLD